MIYVDSIKNIYRVDESNAEIVQQRKKRREVCREERRRQQEEQHRCAWELLQYACQKEYGICSLEELEILKTEYGKPYSRAYPDLHFNLSHCQSGCACVLAENPVGIDIERKFTVRDAFVRRICTDKEQQVMRELSSEEQQLMIQVLWSMKESAVKQNGRGLGYGVERLDFSEQLALYLEKIPDGKNGVPISLTGAAGQNFIIQSTSEYTLAVCGRSLTEKIEFVER